MRYFYDKENKGYMGASNHANGCPKGCAVTSHQPAHSGQVFDMDSEQWTEPGKGNPKPASKRRSRKFDKADYAEKAAGYTDRQLQAAMMRAKGEKLAILQSVADSRA